MQKSNTTADTIASINQQIKLQNNQDSITRRFIYSTLFFGGVSFLPFSGIEMFEGAFALTLIGIWLAVSSLVIAWMFRKRSRKLQSLITGESLLASWQLDKSQKEAYVNYLFEYERTKNQAIFGVMVLLFGVIFGIFILVIEADAKMPMFLAMLGFIAFLSIFAFGMPYYYRRSNQRGDGKILIGAKYAYINGYFHNWDFVLSGLKDVKIIHEPFYGISLLYYYTDRTLRHTEAIRIPANEDSPLVEVIEKMKEANPQRATKKRKK